MNHTNAQAITLQQNDVQKNDVQNRPFQQSGQFLKPLALVDLDDTLFQTHRRIVPQADFQVVTTDKSGQPLAFMTGVQQNFAHWLLSSCDVIPVTARSVEALSRVNIDFAFGAVCSHGGTVLNADKSVNAEWQAHIASILADYQSRQQALMAGLEAAAPSFGSIRTWIVEEQGVGLYVVAKQNTPKEGGEQAIFLPQLLASLDKSLTTGFYFHLNGNNLAFIPEPVSKAAAAAFLLEKGLEKGLENLDHRPILGFGDSLSDVAFLNLCHWWGMPQHSQLNRWLMYNLDEQYQQNGYFGDYPNTLKNQ